MQVTLTPHAQEIVEDALSRGLGRSAEDIVELALESISRLETAQSLVRRLREVPPPSEEEMKRRAKAVDEMLAFREKHNLKLGRNGKPWREFLHEGHRY